MRVEGAVARGVLNLELEGVGSKVKERGANELILFCAEMLVSLPCLLFELEALNTFSGRRFEMVICEGTDLGGSDGGGEVNQDPLEMLRDGDRRE